MVTALSRNVGSEEMSGRDSVSSRFLFGGNIGTEEFI